jgi:hypothetical protein
MVCPRFVEYEYAVISVHTAPLVFSTPRAEKGRLTMCPRFVEYEYAVISVRMAPLNGKRSTRREKGRVRNT